MMPGVLIKISIVLLLGTLHATSRLSVAKSYLYIRYLSFINLDGGRRKLCWAERAGNALPLNCNSPPGSSLMLSMLSAHPSQAHTKQKALIKPIELLRLNATTQQLEIQVRRLHWYAFLDADAGFVYYKGVGCGLYSS